MTSTQLNDALSILITTYSRKKKITTELFEKSYLWSFSMFNSCNENKRLKTKQENYLYDIHSTEPVNKNVVREILNLIECFK
jgi:hypothetical protein